HRGSARGGHASARLGPEACRESVAGPCEVSLEQGHRLFALTMGEQAEDLLVLSSDLAWVEQRAGLHLGHTQAHFTDEGPVHAAEPWAADGVDEARVQAHIGLDDRKSTHGIRRPFSEGANLAVRFA